MTYERMAYCTVPLNSYAPTDHGCNMTSNNVKWLVWLYW